MDTQKLAVVQDGALWRIVDENGGRGDRLTYDEALARAETLARRARWQGRDVDLLIHSGAELKTHLRFRGATTSAP